MNVPRAGHSPRLSLRLPRRRLACLLLAALAAPAATGGTGCWRELQFTARSGWIEASSVLRFDTDQSPAELQPAPPGAAAQPHAARIAKIHARFAALGNTGELDTWYDPQSLAALQTRRLSRGRESRLKTQRFLQAGVWRERLDPVEGAGSAATWRAQSAALIPYPPREDPGVAVITPLMLLARAADLVARRARASEHLVFTDTQLYRVRLVASPTEDLAADFRLTADGEERRVREARQARRVALIPRLLGNDPEKEAFSLMELSGDLAIFVDAQNALPLRVQGSWLRVGTIPAELARAELSPGCAG